MDSLRIAANSIFFKIIFAIIIALFILTGVNSYLIHSRENYIAKVNGMRINREDFEKDFVRELNHIRYFSDQFSSLLEKEDYIKTLRQHILNRLINESLLNQYTKKLGFMITDDQIKTTIFSTNAFQINGKFNNVKYNTIINQMGMNADQYVHRLRNQLTRQQLINGIIGSDFILKGELDELSDLIFQQRVVREATINVNELAINQKATNDEIKAYYEKNKNTFILPEQFRVKYIKLEVDKRGEIASNKEIQYYYDQHKHDEFTQAALYRYSLIQTKIEADANLILEELNNGEDFAMLAQTKSIDYISAKNGGDIGWLEEKKTPEEIKNAGLKNKGQISGVIKSPMGFLVVKLNDIQKEKIQSLDEVRDEIIAKVKNEKAMKVYYDLQKKISKAARGDNQSLSIAEQVSGIKAIETSWFDLHHLPEEINFKEVIDVIYSGNLLDKNGMPGRNSDIITVDNTRAFLVRMIECKPKSFKSLDEVKEEILILIKYHKAKQQAKLNIEKLLTELKAGKSEDVLKTVGIRFGSTKILNRTGQDPIIQAAFSLSLPTKDKPSYGSTYDIQGNIVLLALDEVKSGTLLENQKNMIVQEITKKNFQSLFEGLMKNLHNDAKIKIDVDAI